MKTKTFNLTIAVISVIFLFSCVSADKTPEVVPVYTYGTAGNGTQITLKFEKGKAHNHPLYAVWLADSDGKYIQTLYVSESIGKGFFRRADRNTGKWMPGEIQRPATLPYWFHQRNITNEKGTLLPTPKSPVVDAYTGATPLSSFEMVLATDEKLNGKYQLYLELNQSWDWNEYWTNNKYPDDKEYKTSSQPAVVYKADFDTNDQKEIEMKPIGHSHYAGETGELFTDLSTLSTALKIANTITLTVK